jgi:hypothetical protein
MPRKPAPPTHSASYAHALRLQAALTPPLRSRGQ